MHIIARRMYVLTDLMSKLYTDVGFVRCLVFGKPGVAINSHKRTTHAFRYRVKVVRDFV